MKSVREKNTSLGFKRKHSIMSAFYTGNMLFMSVFLVFSVVRATGADHTCLQDERNGTSVVSQYLDNVIKMKYAPNYMHPTILCSRVMCGKVG